MMPNPSDTSPRPPVDEIEARLIDQCVGKVSFGKTARGLYATDASIYQVLPLGVVVPYSVDDACDAIRVLGAARVPMLPRGGGTSLAGQGVNEAVVIDLSARCHQFVSLDRGSDSCIVEAGMTIDDLNDRLHDSGLFFAPDPSTSRQANIGGCIGNNAAGVHSILYGRTSENVLGIDACLWDGTRVRFDAGAALRDPRVKEITNAVLDVVSAHAKGIRERFPETMRRSSGYQLDVVLDQVEEHGRDLTKINLAPLLCGSEGTLATTLRAELKLHEIPRAKGLAIITFDSIDDAIDAVLPILELEPSAVELLDKLILDLACENLVCKEYVDLLPPAPGGGSAEAVLYVEFFSSRDSHEINGKLERFVSLFPENEVQTHTDAGTMSDAWALRKSGEPLLHAIAGDRKPLGFVEDNAVPVESLGAFISGFREIVESEDTIASYYAHASVGVLHVRPLLDLRDPEDEQRMIRIATRVVDLVKSLGGVPSGEHGDGRVRGPFLEDYFGSDLMGAFRQIKQIFDPHGLLNPGNIVSPGPIGSIVEKTRVKPKRTPVRVPHVKTYYEYSGQNGFAHAVEMCNGAGVCRNKSIGTMCPSYHATLDEHHSTRGRGNALRLAITGQITGKDDGSDWTDQGTKDVMDLCLSCKACKSECPSNVDIAKLKAEYLAQGFDHEGSVPLRVKLFSNIHTLNRMGSLFPWITNSLNRFPPVRSVINHAMGIHASRSLPQFVSPFPDVPIPESSHPKVLLASDTFSTHNEPGIVSSTLRVLRAFGYAVGVVQISDCGRAAISQGNLKHAIRDAERTIDQLEPYIADPALIAILIPEPSCLSAVCDDWRELRINRDRGLRDGLAAKAALPEVFLSTFWDRHPRIPEFDPPQGRIKIHGHCHQKALWGGQSAIDLVERVFGDRVELLDAGCCGMAGAFGYAREKYDLSMKIGEQRLFPAIRCSAPDDVVAASGTSCRHQILDGTGVDAIHTMELLDRLFAESND